MYLLTVLAQSDMNAAGVGGLVAGLTGGGFSLWYGWYTTSVTIPKNQAESNSLITAIVKDFRAEMQLERDAHAAEMKLQREGYQAEIRAQREACQREMEQVVAIFRSTTVSIKAS